MKDLWYRFLEFVIGLIPESWTMTKFMDWWGCPGSDAYGDADLFCQHITFFNRDRLTITFTRKIRPE